MNNYFIIHGSFGNPFVNWFPYLRKEIEKKELEVYTPDFPVSPHIVIETKGRWVLEDRQKMLLIIKQYPDIDFRIVFYNANQKIKKGSKTSYADWCDKHGIKWANKTIPSEWLDDIYDDLSSTNSL